MLVFNIDISSYRSLQKEIIVFAETQAVTDNIAKEYLVAQLLEDTNVLAGVCEETAHVGHSLKIAALKDIDAVLSAYQSIDAALAGYKPSMKRKLRFAEYQQSLEAIVAAEGCEAVLSGIIRHYAAFGGGKSAKYIAFRWDKGLRGIEKPDDIALNQLFCLSLQKQELIENTKAFLEGLPANNVLLYGNSGCGKSSMVKAILNEYCQDGLRLVQIPKEDLAELPLLIREIKGKPFRYIVFMDDLSFESDDLGYKTLKTILDGSVEKQPGNIVFYATSNRLHLINETWAERKGDDVHVSDTKNEKMALSERFGIRISFLSPVQSEYLKIVEGILTNEGISVTEELKAEAIQWAWQCNGLSGRTATQFAATVLPKRMRAKKP